MKAWILLASSMAIVALALLALWHSDPSFNNAPSPKITAILAVACYLMANLLLYCANGLAAVNQARKSKSLEEFDATTAPALQARECDPRIIKWTQIPISIICGASFGALCASAIQQFLK